MNHDVAVPCSGVSIAGGGGTLLVEVDPCDAGGGMAGIMAGGGTGDVADGDELVGVGGAGGVTAAGISVVPADDGVTAGEAGSVAAGAATGSVGLCLKISAFFIISYVVRKLTNG